MMYYLKQKIFVEITSILTGEKNYGNIEAIATIKKNSIRKLEYLLNDNWYMINDGKYIVRNVKKIKL